MTSSNEGMEDTISIHGAAEIGSFTSCGHISISREEAEKGISKTDNSDAAKDQEIEDGELKRIEADGRKKYFLLRERWSNWIISWITALIGFNIVLTMFLGRGWLHFEDMQWFISAITVETFLQIVGLGYVAVRFLFSHR